jgi:uncharacterized membrane protein
VYSIEPLVFCLLSVLAFLPVLNPVLRKKTHLVNTVVFSGGLLILLPCLYLIGRWMAGFPWSRSDGTYLTVFFVIISLVTLITALVALIAWYFRKYPALAVYKNPLNLAMIAGHLTDGFSSYISIYDPFKMGLPSYIEKHPASNLLLEIWPPLFPIIKFLLIILVIYTFDIMYKKELVKYARLVNLLKIGIFILGVSPGIRDLLRVTMGV